MAPDRGPAHPVGRALRFTNLGKIPRCKRLTSCGGPGGTQG